MNKERMIELARMLRDLPPERKFTINYWSCGTSACALGSACLHKPFMEQGLRLCTEEDGLEIEDGKELKWPVYQGEVTYTAGALFFGITEDEAHWLFMPSNYRDKEGNCSDYQDIKAEHVANRVDHIIKLYDQGLAPIPDDQYLWDHPLFQCDFGGHCDAPSV